MLKFFNLCWIFFILNSAWADHTAFEPQCRLLVKKMVSPRDYKRPLRSIETFRVGTYNTMGLFLGVGRYEWTPNGYKKVRGGEPKKDHHLQDQADLIRRIDPDAMVLQEVEGAASLNKFVRDYLDDSYEAFWSPGNDSRGIHIAYIVKRNLPFKVKLYSHADESWVDKSKDPMGIWTRLYSRDLTLLEIRTQDQYDRSPPILTVLGGHYKSKRDRPGDKNSSLLRGAQITRTAANINFYRKFWAERGADVRLMLAADFNGAYLYEKEFLPLWRLAKLEDAANLLRISPRYPHRITYTYHGKNKPTVFSQSDGVMLSENMWHLVSGYRVESYWNGMDEEMLPANDLEERSRQSSDHRATWVDFDFQELLYPQN